MYRNSYQRGMLTIFFSGGSKPLNMWETHTQDGYISRFLDPDIKSMVLEIGGTNVSTTYMICPKGKMVLGIRMPFLIMVVKNLKKYFTFEVTILDETGFRRRFRVANFQSYTQILFSCTVMPIALSEGWNQIQFNLAEFTRRAYNKQFVEVQKMKINANIRIRRIYFAEKLVPEDQLPSEYKLYFPIGSKGVKEKKVGESADSQAKENIEPSATPQQSKSKSTIKKSKSRLLQEASKTKIENASEMQTATGEETNENKAETTQPSVKEEISPETPVEASSEASTEALPEVSAEAPSEAAAKSSSEALAENVETDAPSAEATG